MASKHMKKDKTFREENVKIRNVVINEIRNKKVFCAF